MDKNAIKSIIKNHDSKRLCELNESSFNDFMLTFVYDFLHKMNPENLNSLQKNVLLCTILEDACKSGSIVGLADDKNKFFVLPETLLALESFGAFETAKALKDFIALMPDGTFENHALPKKAFFSETESAKNEISRIDSVISSAPDGTMYSLFFKYICSDENNAKELLSGIAEDAELRTGEESLKIALGSLAAFVIIAVGYCVGRFGFGFEFLALFNFPRTWLSAIAVGAMCPLFLSLFFFGRYCKESGKSKFAYELLNSISAILLAASLLHMLLSLMGVLN